MKMYEVGGCVRDEILGVKSKDIDFTVVLDPTGDDYRVYRLAKENLFKAMSLKLFYLGFEVFLETPEYLTIRARFPITEEYTKYKGLTADFVLARKEEDYTDGRRPDTVIPGTLLDDLARRDFTMNAIAKDPDTGEYIDPYSGIKDIEDKVIVCVGDPIDRFTEDALRAVRALRFSVTKGFRIHDTVARAMKHAQVLDAIVNKISDERIEQELSKMFRFNTRGSIAALNHFPTLTTAMFAGTVSLDATMKTKGRG